MSDGPVDRDDADRGRDDADRDRDASAAGPSRADEERAGADRRDADGDADGDEPSLAAILGAQEEDAGPREIAPGSPSLENAAFVVLGVLFTILVIYRAWTVFVG